MKNRNMTSAVAGITLATVAGTTTYMMSTSRSRHMKAQTKRLRKSAGKAFKNAEHIIGGVTSLLQ